MHSYFLVFVPIYFRHLFCDHVWRWFYRFCFSLLFLNFPSMLFVHWTEQMQNAFVLRLPHIGFLTRLFLHYIIFIFYRCVPLCLLFSFTPYNLQSKLILIWIFNFDIWKSMSILMFVFCLKFFIYRILLFQIFSRD